MHPTRLFIGILILGGCLTGPTTAALPGAPATRVRLDNGLQVLLQPHPLTPAVVVQMWYGAGSANEALEERGLSHLLEHTLAATDSAVNGDHQAVTTPHYTGYLHRLAPTDLPAVLNLEAQRLQRTPSISAPDLKRLWTTMEATGHLPKRASAPSPWPGMHARLIEELFPERPAHGPLGGTPDRYRQLSPEDLQAWHRRWYRPENAVLSIAGNIDLAVVLAQVEAAFAGKAALADPTDTPASPTLVHAAHAPGPVRRTPPGHGLWAGFRVPGFASRQGLADALHLQALVQWLRALDLSSLSPAAPLHLVVRYDPWSSDETLLLFGVEAQVPFELAPVRSALEDVLDQLAEAPLPQAAVVQVRQRLLAATLYQRSDLESLAKEGAIAHLSGAGEDALERRWSLLLGLSGPRLQSTAARWLKRSSAVWVSSGHLQP